MSLISTIQTKIVTFHKSSLISSTASSYLVLFLMLISTIFSLGCRDVRFEDQEIKGLLTIDKSAMGNDYLEIKDKESNMTRFIHAGKKIISITKNMTKINVIIMDSRRVQLAYLRIPSGNLEKEQYQDNYLFVRASASNQDWDLEIRRQKILLQTEYHPTRNTEKCGQRGLNNYAWEVSDYRAKYIVRFLVPGTQKVWAELNAVGELVTKAEIVKLKKCTPPKINLNNVVEVYE